ncbi:MAG: DUF2179 domain-containing protein [Actinobacteria bacterium]|nr:DUF2179 domain-containing protein [Actinomycetota bacterium]
MQILLWTLAIFFGRIADVTLGTIRINFIVRHKKIFAALIGFIEVIIFIFVVSRVIRDLDNNLYGIFAYGAGFAAGTIIGMFISDRLTADFISINIISKERSSEIEKLLRGEGFGATCYDAVGRDGHVKVINVVCKQTFLPKLSRMVFNEDPNAFLNTHLIGSYRGGFLYGLKKK